MVRFGWVVSLAFALLFSSFVSADESDEKPPMVKWGEIRPIGDWLGVTELIVSEWPENGKLELPTPFANILSATHLTGKGSWKRTWLQFEYNADASSIWVQLPKQKEGSYHVSLAVECDRRQFADGRIALSASDAKILPAAGQTAPKAKLESHPGNLRIGYWTDAAETVMWDYTATRPGMYDVELTYSGDGTADTEIEIMIGEKSVPLKLLDTGSWYRYTTGIAGKVYIPAAGPISIAVKCTKKTGPAVMNLKAVVLRPACEGKMPEQAEDGTITLHARDVTIWGTKVQYEPKPEKNTVGYWVEWGDWINWYFVAKKRGKYQVEILQGCGKGQGGSKVSFSIVGKTIGYSSFTHTVEDTGHFQNFKPFIIGTVELEAGLQSMLVSPHIIAKDALMDLREVRLIPVKE